MNEDNPIIQELFMRFKQRLTGFGTPPLFLCIWNILNLNLVTLQEIEFPSQGFRECLKRKVQLIFIQFGAIYSDLNSILNKAWTILDTIETQRLICNTP